MSNKLGVLAVLTECPPDSTFCLLSLSFLNPQPPPLHWGMFEHVGWTQPYTYNLEPHCKGGEKYFRNQELSGCLSFHNNWLREEKARHLTLEERKWSLSVPSSFIAICVARNIFNLLIHEQRNKHLSGRTETGLFSNSILPWLLTPTWTSLTDEDSRETRSWWGLHGSKDFIS